MATALLELVERSVSGRSAPTVELNVHRSNENALGFYKHVGFAHESWQPGKLFAMAMLGFNREPGRRKRVLSAEFRRIDEQCVEQLYMREPMFRHLAKPSRFHALLLSRTNVCFP